MCFRSGRARKGPEHDHYRPRYCILDFPGHPPRVLLFSQVRQTEKKANKICESVKWLNVPPYVKKQEQFDFTAHPYCILHFFLSI